MTRIFRVKEEATKPEWVSEDAEEDWETNRYWIEEHGWIWMEKEQTKGDLLRGAGDDRGAMMTALATGAKEWFWYQELEEMKDDREKDTGIS